MSLRRDHQVAIVRIVLLVSVVVGLFLTFHSELPSKRGDQLDATADDKKSLLIRTSFGDAESWQKARELAVKQHPGVVEMMRRMANLDDDPKSIEELESRLSPCSVIDDEEYDGADIPDLLPIASENGNGVVLFIYDELSSSHPDHSLRVVNLLDPDQTFRVQPEHVNAVQNNLVATQGLAWDVFSSGVDQDGIYRGPSSR